MTMASVYLVMPEDRKLLLHWGGFVHPLFKIPVDDSSDKYIMIILRVG